MSKVEKKFLVTGAAGFIGAALVYKLLEDGYQVIGIDDLNDYYDPNLKKARLNLISNKFKSRAKLWKFVEGKIEHFQTIKSIFEEYKPEIVINLAAQAGVRFSLERPDLYLQSNVLGFGNILELSKQYKVENLIFASSSSVYGESSKLPFTEDQTTNKQISIYAATKKSNELMAYVYSNLFGLSTIGLRFFTVYGPWGRPDMAPMIFAKAILKSKNIQVFNKGLMKRDFTYIDDVVESIIRCSFKKVIYEKEINNNKITESSQDKFIPHKIFNIGFGKSVELMDFITSLEKELGMVAKKEFVSIQKGDVKSTEANTDSLHNWINYKPQITLEKGIKRFARWYKDFYEI